MNKEERQKVNFSKEVRKLEEYFSGSDSEPGKNLAVNSIISQLHHMMNNHVIFSAFNEVGLLMQKREDFNNFFSSNIYLRNILTNHYFLDQSLHIRRLTDGKTEESGSLIAFLNRAKRNREIVYRTDKKKYGLDIDDSYIDSLKKKLAESESIKEIRDYADQYVAHADLKPKEVNFNIMKIKECHEVIIDVFEDVSLRFFDTDRSSFAKISLTKEQILRNSNKPFSIIDTL